MMEVRNRATTTATYEHNTFCLLFLFRGLHVSLFGSHEAHRSFQNHLLYTGLLNCLLAAVKGPRENRLLYIVLFTISYPRGRENMCKLVYMHTYANRHICIYRCICVCAYCMQVYTYMIYDTKPPRCQEKTFEKPPLGMPPKAACRRVVGGMCGKLGKLRSSSPHLEKNVSQPSYPDPQNKGLEGKEQTFFENIFLFEKIIKMMKKL